MKHMKLISLLAGVAATAAVTFLISTYGAIDALTSSGVFTAALLVGIIISDYKPRRSFLPSTG